MEKKGKGERVWILLPLCNGNKATIPNQAPGQHTHTHTWSKPNPKHTKKKTNHKKKGAYSAVGIQQGHEGSLGGIG